MATRAVLIAVFLAVSGGCVAAKKASDAGRAFAYTDWGAFNTVLKSGNVLFGAGTDTTPEGQAVYSMLAVMFANACSPQILSVTYDLDAPAVRSVKSKSATGEIRVDDLAPVKAAYTYQIDQGKTKVFIDFNEAFRDDARVGQLVKGHLVSVKAVVEGKELSFRFSLRNHVEAVNSAVTQCEEEAAFRSGGQGKGAGKGAPAAPGSGGSPASPMGGSGRSGGDDSRFFKGN